MSEERARRSEDIGFDSDSIGGGDCEVGIDYDAFHSAAAAVIANTKTATGSNIIHEEAFGPKNQNDRVSNINKRTLRWEANYDSLLEYKARHGDCLVRYNDQGNPQLARWVDRQRVLYRQLMKGVGSQMTEERATRLKEVGFIFSLSSGTSTSATPAYSGKWEESFASLLEYKAQHGDCLVKYNYEGNNPQLAGWVGRQRYWYRKLMAGKKSQMTQERVRRLTDAGFAFSISGGSSSSSAENATGTAGAASSPSEINASATGKSKYNGAGAGINFDAAFSAAATAIANTTANKVNKHTVKWEANFASLLEYKARHGNCLVRYNYEGNPRLGRWADRQRYWYRLLLDGKKSQMTNERVERLKDVGLFQSGGTGCSSSNSVGGGNAADDLTEAISSEPAASHNLAVATAKGKSYFGCHKERWDARFWELCEFRTKTGHLKVPIQYPQSPSLYKWVEKQKTELRRRSEGKPSQMDGTREERLREIGLKRSSRIAKWNERWEALRAFRSQYGHVKLPYTYVDDPQLAGWVYRQRSEMKNWMEGRKSKLTDERIEKLRELDFWDGDDVVDGAGTSVSPAVAAEVDAFPDFEDGKDLAEVDAFPDFEEENDKAEGDVAAGDYALGEVADLSSVTL